MQQKKHSVKNKCLTQNTRQVIIDRSLSNTLYFKAKQNLRQEELTGGKIRRHASASVSAERFRF